jgi:hypothetical protein
MWLGEAMRPRLTRWHWSTACAGVGIDELTTASALWSNLWPKEFGCCFKAISL